MAWLKTNLILGYVVIYVANGTQIKKRVKKNDDCIAAAPSVSKPGYAFLGWREDNRPIEQVLSRKICDRKGIVLYAVWKKTIVHGGTVTAGAGEYGYDTEPNGSGKNWSTGATGPCDRRCGYNCGVTGGHTWIGSGWNEANIDPITGLPDGTYTPHPSWHGDLSAEWTKTDTSIAVG